MRWPWRRTALDAVRWVAVDCESSGLDAKRDRLLALGAVVVRAGRIEPAESFRALLRQERPSDPGNILVHGIGGEAQLAGRPAAEALEAFRAFLGDAVPVAFHAACHSGVATTSVLRAVHAAWAAAPTVPTWFR